MICYRREGEDMVKKKPEWIRLKIQNSKHKAEVESIIENMHLNTVCNEANCPNKMECFSRGTATFMIMGKNCTRNCKFCNIETRRPMPLDPEEPKHLALAVQELGLKHVVVTSVDRDDLPDEGSHHFYETCRLVKEMNPGTTVELLIPDFHGREELLQHVLDAKPDVLNHNMETVLSKFSYICPQSDYHISLKVLDFAKKKGFVTKSGMMVGLGETFDEVIGLMKDLRKVGCDMLTIGQYLQPSMKHIEVEEYIEPKIFEEYASIGRELGFKRVVSSPFARSSYHAEAL